MKDKITISAKQLLALDHQKMVDSGSPEARKQNREKYTSKVTRFKSTGNLPSAQKLHEVAELFGLVGGKSEASDTIQIEVDRNRWEEINA